MLRDRKNNSGNFVLSLMNSLTPWLWVMPHLAKRVYYQNVLMACCK